MIPKAHCMLDQIPSHGARTTHYYIVVQNHHKITKTQPFTWAYKLTPFTDDTPNIVYDGKLARL